MPICIIDKLGVFPFSEESIVPKSQPRLTKGIDGKASIHSFIIRMRLEQSDEDGDRVIWRGRITHVPGDEHQYFTDIKTIPKIIRSYLKDKS
jgi:hypothetical protein